MTSVTHPIILAQAPEPKQPKRSDPFLQRGEDWLLVGLMAAALIVGAVVVWAVDRWRKRITSDAGRSGEELTSFRAMYERGEITEEEYNKVRNKVATRVKTAPAAPAGPGAAGGPAAASAPGPAAGGQPAAPPVPGYFADEETGPQTQPPPAKPWDRGPNGMPPPA
jgi:hypothetical protein